MNGELNNLVALRMRKLIAQYGAGSQQLAEAVRELLAGQRAVIAETSDDGHGGDILAMPRLAAVR